MFSFPGFGGDGFGEPDFYFPDDEREIIKDPDEGPGGGDTIIVPEIPPGFDSGSLSVSNSAITLNQPDPGITNVTVSATCTFGGDARYGPYEWQVYTMAGGYSGPSSSWAQLPVPPHSSTTVTRTLSFNKYHHGLSSHGSSTTFSVHIRYRRSGLAQTNYTVIKQPTISVTNNLNPPDSTAPVHGAKQWVGSGSHTFADSGTNSTNTVTKTATFVCSDPESPITATAEITSNSYASVQSVTQSGTTYTVVVSINGSNVPVGTNSSLSLRLRAVTATHNVLSGALTLTVSKPDDTPPGLSNTTSGGRPTLTYYTNNTDSQDIQIKFNVHEYHPSRSLSGPYLIGSLSTSNGRDFYQTARVPHNAASAGGSTTLTYTAQATDGSSNTGTLYIYVDVVRNDNTVPTFTSLSDPSDKQFRASGTDGTDTYRDFIWRVNDNVSINKNDSRNSFHRVSGVGDISSYHQGWSGNEFHGRVYYNASEYAYGASSTLESYRLTVYDTAGNPGTSSAISHHVSRVDNTKPSISVQHVDAKTFYTSGNTGNPTGQTAVGYIYWSAADSESGISSRSATSLSNTYLVSSDTGYTTTTSDHGAQYRTTYKLRSNFPYGNNFTTRSNVVRLTATNGSGLSQTEDVDIQGKLIDNSHPYFTAVSSRSDHIWYTSNGNTQTKVFSGYADFTDVGSGVDTNSIKVTKYEGTMGDISVSTSGNRISFSFTASSADHTYGQFRDQKVQVEITDNGGNKSSTQVHVGRTTLIENVAPSVSGPTRKDGINFYKNNYPNGSQTVVVSFTASDAHSSISVDDMQILKNYPAHYIAHSHPTHQGGNNYQYTVTIPHDGKGLTYEEEYWGYTTVRVYDSHGNYSDLTTEYYGEHIDNILPVISNNFCSAFNFTPSTADSLTQQLTFRATDNDTSQSPTVSVIKGSGVHSASSPVGIGNGTIDLQSL